MRVLKGGSPGGARLGQFDQLRDEILFASPRLIHQLLELMLLGCALIAAGCMLGPVVKLYGLVPLALTALLGCFVLAVRLNSTASAQSKAIAAVGAFLVGSVSTVFFTGTSGLSAALVGGTCILGLVVGTPTSRKWSFGLAGIAVWVPAAFNGLGITELVEMRSVLPVDWILVWSVAFPAIALTLFVVSRVTGEVRKRREELAKANQSLAFEYAQVARSADALKALLDQQRSEIVRRTRYLENLEADATLLSDRCLGSILDSVHSLKEVASLLLKSESAFPEVTRGYLARAEKRVREMEGIVLGFRALAEPLSTGGERIPVECTAIVGRLLRGLHESAPSRAYQLDAPEEVWVVGELGLIEALIRNLVENAWKFTVDRQVTHLAIRPYSDGAGSGFTLQDNGIGMDAATKSSLFRERGEGGTDGYVVTGLGLLIVRQIVLRYQGTITVESELGVGTTFYVSLGAPQPDLGLSVEEEAQFGGANATRSETSEPDDAWMTPPLRLLMNWMLGLLLGTLALVLPAILSQRSWSVLVVDLAMVFSLLAARLQRRWVGEQLALAALAPMALGAVGMWTFTADFSAPVSLSMCLLSMVLLFLHPNWFAPTVGTLVVASVVGFFTLTGGQTSGLTEPIPWVQYWVLGFAIIAVPVLITLHVVESSFLLMADAVHRLEEVGNRSRQAIEAVRRLNEQRETLRDTLEHRIQQRLRAIQLAQDAQASLTNSISHDLRSPLRVCNNFYTLVASEPGDTSSQIPRHHLEEAIQLCNRLLTDVETTVRISKILQLGEPESVEDLAESAAFQLDVWSVEPVHIVARPAILRELLTQLNEVVLERENRKGTLENDGARVVFTPGVCRPDWVAAVAAVGADSKALEARDANSVLHVHNFERICRAVNATIQVNQASRVLTLIFRTFVDLSPVGPPSVVTTLPA